MIYYHRHLTKDFSVLILDVTFENILWDVLSIGLIKDLNTKLNDMYGVFHLESK